MKKRLAIVIVGLAVLLVITIWANTRVPTAEFVLEVHDFDELEILVDVGSARPTNFWPRNALTLLAKDVEISGELLVGLLTDAKTVANLQMFPPFMKAKQVRVGSEEGALFSSVLEPADGIDFRVVSEALTHWPERPRLTVTYDNGSVASPQGEAILEAVTIGGQNEGQKFWGHLQGNVQLPRAPVRNEQEFEGNLGRSSWLVPPTNAVWAIDPVTGAPLSYSLLLSLTGQTGDNSAGSLKLIEPGSLWVVLSLHDQSLLEISGASGSILVNTRLVHSLKPEGERAKLTGYNLKLRMNPTQTRLEGVATHLMIETTRDGKTDSRTLMSKRAGLNFGSLEFWLGVVWAAVVSTWVSIGIDWVRSTSRNRTSQKGQPSSKKRN